MRMKDLEQMGLGCIVGVGKAAIEHSGEPALVILSRQVKNDEDNRKKRVVSLVGKGIVFDTGGLSIKSREGMCEMKVNCSWRHKEKGGFYALFVVYSVPPKRHYTELDLISLFPDGHGRISGLLVCFQLRSTAKF